VLQGIGYNGPPGAAEHFAVDTKRNCCIIVELIKFNTRAIVAAVEFNGELYCTLINPKEKMHEQCIQYQPL
jgi:hypothetical protein